MPDYLKTLSLKLYNVLDDIGASTEMRKLMTDEYSAEEKLETFIKGPKYSAHVFGSAYEGSQTRGMKSDVDTVYVDEELPVITDIGSDAAEKCLLMIQDHSTPAGYTKLQLVHNGIPLTEESPPMSSPFTRDNKYNICVDDQARLVCTFCPSNRSIVGTVGRHGPALTQTMNKHIADKDILFAFRSQELPCCVEEWFSRKRLYDWPTQSDFEACKTMGCLYVPIGHPNSDEKYLQWRMSLSHQERSLLTHFNSVQLKCFVLLKLVKKDIIWQLMRKDSLTSYHCKTCMFFVMENTPLEFWIPQNLLAAFVSCMNMLLAWTQVGLCPNYFIPCENLFDRDIHGQVRDDLERVLRSLTSTTCEYLLQITTDDVGQRLEHSLSSVCNSITSSRHVSENPVVEHRKMDLYYTHLSFALRKRTELLEKSSTESPTMMIHRVEDTIAKLGTLRDTDNVASAKSGVVNLVKDYIEIGRLSGIIACAKERNEHADVIRNHITSIAWNDVSLETDRYSAKLKQACHMCALGHYQSSLEILSGLGDQNCFTICFCDQARPIHPFGPKFQTSEYAGMTAQEHLHKYMIPCIVFCQGEKNIIPGAICTEIDHAEDNNRQSQYKGNMSGKIACIDGTFLIHFLYYLNHSTLNMTQQAESEIKNMERIVNKRKISHKETALNLLGWVLHQHGRYNASADYFYRSLEIKPEENAANWHIKQIKAFTDG